MKNTTTQQSQEFISSLSYDIRLAPYEIAGSMAHAEMLGRTGIIKKNDAKRIIQGLKAIKKDLERGKNLPYDEDIHYAIERELTRRIGTAGEKLHTARSRNDQITLDLRLYLRDQINFIMSETVHLAQAFLTLAQKNITLIMPGFTHLQHGQPILFSHHILAYAWMLERDKRRFQDCLARMDEMPLGSAALAGTSFPIDRNFVAKALNFSQLSENSIDAVSDRDFVAEFLSSSAICMMHLSRLAEELVLWSSPEFNFVRLADEFTSGSSIMPQKRNPDVAELVRGQTGRIFGNLVALLTMLKGLPLSYNRDMQEDKPPLFDTIDTLTGALAVMIPLIQSLKVNGERLRKLCERGYLAATELADYLAKKGVPFRQAHHTVRNIVSYCQKNTLNFEDLKLEDLKRFHSKFDNGAINVLSIETAVRAKTSRGGTAPSAVARQIAILKKRLG